MLFIDCDDTLVIWDDKTIQRKGPFNEYTSTDWSFNQRLIDWMLEKETELGPVIIWSGGGRQYAELWLSRLERHVGRSLSFTARAKDINLIRDGDIVVDDMPLIVRDVDYTMIDARAFD